MKSLGRKPFSVCLVLLIGSLAGCGVTRPGSLLQASREHPDDRHAPSSGSSNVIQARLLAPRDSITVRAVQENKRPAIDQELSVDALVVEVLARNPNLTQMVAAWQAASAKYPQVRSLDDPMLGSTFAPASFNSNSVAPGYSIEISQKIPFPGKLRLRGQGALSEASAAQNDVEDMRVQLIEAAKLAFYDYYLVDRALSVNDEGLKLLKEFRDSADSRFKTGLVPQQDILQAEVEIGKQRERGVTLDRMRKVAVARINTLRNLDPNEPIPPPPAKLSAASGLPPVARLREYALAQRPDLKALQDRITTEETGLALAFREFYPDVEVFGGYNTIMGNGPMRDLAPQVGVRVNLPIRTARRNGAVEEARAKILQKRAELDSRVNQLNFQVQEAYEQLLESERILVLYDKTILPAAQANVKAAQAAYTTGKTPFLSLIEAQRNLVNLRDRNYEATADYFRRLATLERVTGGPVSTVGTPVLNQKK
jgi:cobalt-zinc-cadmium efflux system outer membrane protein